MALQKTSTSNGSSFKQEPAQESSKASGRGVVGRYMTKGGAVGVEVTVSERTGRLSYTGKWGAGSGHDEAAMAGFLRQMLAGRRGVVAVIPFAGVAVQS